MPKLAPRPSPVPEAREMDTQRSSHKQADRPVKTGGGASVGDLDPGKRHPDLRPSMTSDHAFSLVVLRCLATMVANRDATARSDPTALHQMRISVTCLKAAAAFFSPMVDDDQWRHLKLEFKWLNSHLGAARDLDVVIGQLAARGNGDSLPAKLRQDWSASHARVAAALKSERFRRLISNAAEWVQRGDWRRRPEAASHPVQAMTIADYSRRRLARWRTQILSRSSELEAMAPETRHRLRIRTKRLRYATEWFGEFLPGSTPKSLRATLKQLRRAQTCLGELNDAERARALLEASGAEQAASPKRDKQLLRASQAAFATLTALTDEN